MMNKKGYEFSFGWIFAIIIGAVIIFLAVYSATQIVGTKRIEQETVRAKQIGILLSPVETSLESGKVSTILVGEETKIHNNCSLRGTFGSQDISTSIKSGIGEEWLLVPGVANSFHNKYLFSPSISKGEEFFILSKPLKMPFKLADLVIMWSDQETYCFIKPLDEIDKELADLNPKNIEKTNSIDACSTESKRVCFPPLSSPSCDIIVSTNSKSVTKNGETVNYIESSDRGDKFALLYAAIFSEPKIYNCQLQRLADRASELAKLHKEKSEFLETKECGSSVLKPILNSYSSKANSLSEADSRAEIKNRLNSLRQTAEELKEKNAPLICKLF